MSAPLAYFITFTTYGSWLHGRDPGSVDRHHNIPGTPFLPVNRELEESHRKAMRQAPYLLDEARRSVVLQTIHEVANHRRWRLWAVHVRTNHVHIIVTAALPPETLPPKTIQPETIRAESIRAESVSDGSSSPEIVTDGRSSSPKSVTAGNYFPKPPTPEKVMTDLKSWTSRRLNESFNEPADREHWTRHGSTRWLNTHASLQEAIRYVIDDQGDPMAYFDGRNSECPAPEPHDPKPSDPKPYEPKAYDPKAYEPKAYEPKA